MGSNSGSQTLFVVGPQLQGVDLAAVEGQEFSSEVVLVTVLLVTSSDGYSASIDWGDGSSSSCGDVSLLTAGILTISGSHTDDDEGDGAGHGVGRGTGRLLRDDLQLHYRERRAVELARRRPDVYLDEPVHFTARASGDSSGVADRCRRGHGQPGNYATDPNSNPLTYDALGCPPDLSIDSHTGVISGTICYDAAETFWRYTPTVIVSNGQGGSTSTSFNWTVYAAAAAADWSRRPGQCRGADRVAANQRHRPGRQLVDYTAGLPGGLSIDQDSGVISGSIDPDAASRRRMW